MINIRVYVRREFRSPRWSLWRGWEKYWWTEPWWQWWSCDSPVDEVVFCLQQGFPNSILVLVILKSDLALPHVWLEKVVFGEKRCLNQTPTFFQTKVSEWIFSLTATQRFFTVGLRKDGQGQRVPFYYYDNTTPSPNQCFNISEFKRNSTKRMFFITTGILHH